jgi:hypothetical protein
MLKITIPPQVYEGGCVDTETEILIYVSIISVVKMFEVWVWNLNVGNADIVPFKGFPTEITNLALYLENGQFKLYIEDIACEYDDKHIEIKGSEYKRLTILNDIIVKESGFPSPIEIKFKDQIPS